MATSASTTQLPLYAVQQGLTQSTFLPRTVNVLDVAPQTPLLTNGNNKAFKLNTSRSSSTLKLPNLRQVSKVADGIFHQSSASKVESPQHKSKANYVSAYKFSIKSGTVSPKKKKHSPMKVQHSFSLMMDDVVIPQSPNENPILMNKLMLSPPTKSLNDLICEDELTCTPSDQETLSKNTEQNKPKLVVKKRHNLVVCSLSTKKRSRQMVIDKQGVERTMHHDYFINHLKSCAATLFESSPASRLSIESQSKNTFYYIEQSFNILKTMKFDQLVCRQKTATYHRKYPHRKLLLLDLDETLIHCTGDLNQRGKFDMEIDFINDEGVDLKGLLNIRPHAKRFLQTMSQHYEVVIFTASMKYYADRIMQILDPQKQFITSMFYRDSCAKTRSEKVVKDLTIFGGVSLEDMILVDNNMYCMWPQPHNGIPILHFEHNRNDRELVLLEDFLMQIKDMPNHTEYFKKHFKVNNLFTTYDFKQYIASF